MLQSPKDKKFTFFFLNVAPFAEAKFMFIIGPPISKNTKTIAQGLYKLILMIQKYKTLNTFID
jgi:hypothetical protein